MDIQRTPVKTLILIGLFLSLLLVRPEISFADSTFEKAGEKLIRGVVNVTTGWIEIFHQIYEVTWKLQTFPTTTLCCTGKTETKKKLMRRILPYMRNHKGDVNPLTNLREFDFPC